MSIADWPLLSILVSLPKKIGISSNSTETFLNIVFMTALTAVTLSTDKIGHVNAPLQSVFSL